MEEGRSAYKILTAKPTGWKPLGIGVNKRNWVDSSQDKEYCGSDTESPGSISHVRQLINGIMIKYF